MPGSLAMRIQDADAQNFTRNFSNIKKQAGLSSDILSMWQLLMVICNGLPLKHSGYSL